MEKKLLLIGGGGHCHSVLDSVLATNEYNQIGVVAKDQDNYNDLLEDSFVATYLIGTDKDLTKLYDEGWNEAFITLGSVGSTKGRRFLFSVIEKNGFVMPIVVDPSAIVSDKAKISAGVFIGKRAVVNAGSNIGVGAIVNSGSIIEHDCEIGDFAHVSPGATICGQVTVSEDSHIGAGSVVRQGVSIGRGALIGAGSVVVKNIPDNVKAYGNPCRVVE